MVMSRPLPRYFTWYVSRNRFDKSFNISINFLEFDRAAEASNFSIYSVREVAMEASRFILTTPKYASFLNSCNGLINTNNNASYMEKYLTHIGRYVSTHHSHISEQDAINHFFGIAPIPDEKILMMM